MSLMLSRQQAGASSSSAACGQLLRCTPCPIRQSRHCGRSQQPALCASSGSSDSFTRDAQAAAERAFKQAKGKWQSFAKDQRLEQRASEAMNKAGASAREAADKASDKAKRVFVHLDSEYELTSKTARAAKRAEEVARDIDQTYGVRRRVRSSRDYMTRMWPTWQRKLDHFTGTWYGKVTVFGTICIVVSSPIFWSFVNVMFLLWWLSVPLSLVLLDYARKQQAQRLKQEAAEEAEQARRAANPFAEMFRGAWGAGAGGAASGAAASRGRFTQQDGPVIDAEWTSIDDGDVSGSTSTRGRR